MNSRKILIIFSISPYNEQAFTASFLYRHLTDCGYEVGTVNTSSNLSPEQIMYEIRTFHPDLAITLDLSGFDYQLLGDDLFYNALYCPIIHLLYRHPGFFPEYLNQRMNFTMEFFSPYPEYADYAKSYYPRIPSYRLIPPLYIPGIDSVPFAERKIDIYFPSSYVPSEDILGQISALPQVFQDICRSLIHRCQQNPHVLIHNELKSYLANLGISYSDEEFRELMVPMQLVKLYLKMKSCEKYISFFLKQGFSVTVSGDNWHKFPLSVSPNLTILNGNCSSGNGLSFDTMLQTMGNSKIVLNLQYHKNTGIHPRITCGLSCGAFCVTNENADICKTFADNDKVVLLSEEHPKETSDKISSILKGSFTSDTIRKGLTNINEYIETIVKDSFKSH